MKEIERNPEVSQLNPKTIGLLTQLCFRSEDNLEVVDGIFAYGTFHFHLLLAKKIQELLRLDITKQVFLTGGIVQEKESVQNVSEAELTLDAIDQMRFPNIVFHTETGSTNSLENVTESLKNPEFACCKSILMIFKTHDVGRGYLTLRKFFPTAKILLQSFDVIYSGQDKAITKDNWHTFDFGRSRVWGEFLRIKKYGERGDIAYDEVRGLVTDIEQEVESLQ